LDVAVIGAGPYGLSIAAHLAGAGIEHRVFGETMACWRNHMPSGMFLKSYGESSDLYDPRSELTLRQFCNERGIPYHDSTIPVSLETFVAYGTAFQQRFVPRVEQTRLVALAETDRGFALSFDNGEAVTARRVVLAVGVLPFKYVPPNLAHLPAALFSHSSDWGSLDRLAGKEVTVIGSGASALDITALLIKRGSKVTLVSRSPELHFGSQPDGAKQSLLRRMLSPHLHGLGSGWLMTICSDAPQIIHALPDSARLAILNHYLGPSGTYYVRALVEQSTTKVGRTIESADERGGRIHLATVDRSGARETIVSDHLIAATGYKIELNRLGFLNQETLRRVRTIDGTPILTSKFESSIPGLYFVGLSAARSFGPALRFVVGAVHPARRLARVMRGSSRRRSSSAAASVSN
jgi:thioredoxin reductase